MFLQFRGDVDAADEVCLAGGHQVELDVGAGLGVIHRKIGGPHLAAERFFQPAVAAVNDDPVAGNVDRREKGDAHQVIPVQMGNEEVIHLWVGDAVTGNLALAEGAGAGADIADEMLRAAGDDLDAGRVAAKRAAHGKRQRFDEGVEFGLLAETAAIGGQQCAADLGTDVGVRDRGGQGAAGTPENDLFHVPSTSQAASTVA